MNHYFLDNRTIKAAELSSKEADLALIEKEVDNLQYPEYQVRLIEAHLAKQYNEERKNYPINRKQELEISNVIKEKISSVERALKARKKGSNKASRKRNSEQFDEPEFVSSWEDSWLEEKEKRERFERDVERKRDKFNRDIEKTYENSVKVLDRECIDELKRIFGELKVDIRRFHRNGISKENLFSLVIIMDQIYTEASKIGTVPVSFQTEIYKWRQVLNEIPEDSELRNKEVEAIAKAALIQKLNGAKKYLSEAQENMDLANKRISNTQKEILKTKKMIEEAEESYQPKIEEIKANSENKRNELKKELDKKIQYLNSEYEERRRSINNRIKEREDKLMLQNNELEALLKEKREAEAALEKAFALSFGKKRAYREQIESIDNSVKDLESKIQKDQNILRTLEREYPEENRDYEVREKQRRYGIAIAYVSEEEEKSIEKLDSELAQLKADLAAREKDIKGAEKELLNLPKVVENYAQSVEQMEHELSEFHINYMIKTYGKKIKIEELIKDTKTEIDNLKAEIKTLKEDIAELDEAEKLVGEERIRKEEEYRKAQIAKAAEEERIRKEAEERRKRIEAELREKEDEQKRINAKANSLLHVLDIVSEFEENPEHGLLQKGACPLEDNGKRVITNSILRKRYTQISETPSCEQYALVFVDHKGTTVSEQRLIQQKHIGEITTTSFELKANNGFDGKNYYLLIINFDSGEIICAQKYKINIAFVNDFDF